MPSLSDYLYATKCAVISPDQILAPSMQKNKNMTAQVMNGAFKFYYDAYRAAGNISGSGRSQEAIKAIYDLRWSIQKDLLASADFWIGSDLKFVFKELAKNGGKWTHDEWNGWKGICNIPQGVFSFYAEIEKKGREVSAETAKISSYRQWHRYQGTLKQIKDSESWEKLAKELEYAEQVFEKATPKVWAVLGGTSKTGEMLAGHLSKWCGYAGSVHGYLTLYNKIRYSPQGAGRTAVAEAAAMVVEKLPMFGPLYAEVVRGVPGLMKWFEEYGRNVERSTRGQFSY